MTPDWIRRILEHDLTWALARVFGTFFYWFAGLGFLFNFASATGAVASFGMQPVALIAAATIFVQLTGSALVIADRLVWLGAGMLAGFTILTVLLVHDWWTMEGPERMRHYLEAQEHLTVLGGLLAITILSQIRREWRARRPA
jgi:transmembrane protein